MQETCNDREQHRTPNDDGQLVTYMSESNRVNIYLSTKASRLTPSKSLHDSGVGESELLTLKDKQEQEQRDHVEGEKEPAHQKVLEHNQRERHESVDDEN